MDRIKEASNLIKKIKLFKNNEYPDYKLITNVCSFFDNMKAHDLSQADLKFMKYLSNIVGIPHYYDLLENFDNHTAIDNIDLCTFASIMHESSLHVTEEQKLHRYQMIILDKFNKETTNRFFLSASTSFGKTHLVYEIIRKMNYSNIVLMFPTIALLTENIERILSDYNYSFIKDEFNVHTLSDISGLGEKNIFIYTPERYLSFLEKKHTTCPNLIIDFYFIDEIYKIDNEYIIDEQVRENERDIAYRIALNETVKNNIDLLLAGPYIALPNTNTSNKSFNNFIEINKIKTIDSNQYEIVNKSKVIIKTQKKATIDYIEFNFDNPNKTTRLISIVHTLVANNENCIVYCSKVPSTESLAKRLIESGEFDFHIDERLCDFYEHLSTIYGDDWILTKSIGHGIGVHNGLIPKHIQKEIIRLFNEGLIKVLFSTTTLTEGVNTTAKNIVIYDHNKGNKELKPFDAKNIAGRAGRFLKHYSGRVIILQNKFNEILENNSEPIKHKNYDIDSEKDEIDLFITQNDFLTKTDIQKVENILVEMQNRGLPEELIEHYQVIGIGDKIKLFDLLNSLNISDKRHISELIRILNIGNGRFIYKDGLQVILNLLLPIVKNNTLKFLIEKKDKNEIFSVLTHVIFFYVKDGYMGSVDYNMKQRKFDKDKAIRESSRFIFNTLKYQVVKYMGVFNLIYKYIEAKNRSKPVDEISGIDNLLVKLEYNALTHIGRKASDFGVTERILAYYENPEKAENIKRDFDDYENRLFNHIDPMIQE